MSQRHLCAGCKQRSLWKQSQSAKKWVVEMAKYVCPKAKHPERTTFSISVKVELDGTTCNRSENATWALRGWFFQQEILRLLPLTPSKESSSSDGGCARVNSSMRRIRNERNNGHSASISARRREESRCLHQVSPQTATTYHGAT